MNERVMREPGRISLSRAAPPPEDCHEEHKRAAQAHFIPFHITSRYPLIIRRLSSR
jgi:hypothetical protein